MTNGYTVAVCKPQALYSAVAIPSVFRFGENIPMGYLRNLAAIRKQRKMTQQQLADAVGVEQPTIQRYEKGRSPSLTQAVEIAEVLGVSLNELVNSGELVPLGPRLFIKGEVAAGVWKEAIEWPPEDWQTFTGRADVTADLQHRFGLRVAGESMNDLYPPGTVVECVSVFGRAEIESGKRVVVVRERIDGEFEATVKEYIIDEAGREWLRPRSNHPSFQQWHALDEEEPGIVERRITAIVVGSFQPE